MTLPELIPNVVLRENQVPDYYVPGLDPLGFNAGADFAEGSDSRKWNEIWNFALTFDGYKYFGDDSGSPERLANFGQSVEAAFVEDGELPALDLAFLRACLFIQQRYWLKWGGVMTRSCPPATAKYIDALLRSIKSEISS